jgi:dynein heavy chain
MNYVTMANIFKGLSQTGAWGCFDEFNRIPIEVLSVVATQVKSVLDAIVYFGEPENREDKWKNDPKAGPFGKQPGQPPCVVGEFILQDDTIRLVPTTGFFITMNPGYAGRTELPENLKALFRSCAMIRPDLEPICENMLMAEGFESARVLSIKFVKLYSLSSELLSPQPHYDWGLRSVKSVLRVAGMLKRDAKRIAEAGGELMSEEAVLMRALRDFNTPKMPMHDVPVFLRLVEDLFPASYKTPAKVDVSLANICREYCRLSHLQSDTSFTLKVSQFQELLDVRHSVMLIGPAGCGKTTIWKALAGSWNHGYRQPVGSDGKPQKSAKAIAISKIVNPKSITSDELYGFMTLAKEWKDGVLSIIMRGMSKNFKELGYSPQQQYKWVVLDGDIDAVWIESMNTVMDDNKVLTLVSNEPSP